MIYNDTLASFDGDRRYTYAGIRFNGPFAALSVNRLRDLQCAAAATVSRFVTNVAQIFRQKEDRSNTAVVIESKRSDHFGTRIFVIGAP